MLVVRELEVTYQGVIAAVRGVTLEVPERGVVALLGANGAGKTSILRAISGLLRTQGGRITHGSVEFDGQSITSLEPTRIVRMGIAQVLEGRRLFGSLSVDENLRAGAFASRDAAATRRSYDRVMELFPILRERRRSAAGYLSGGEQQMLAIGRGLMAKPRVLILDEPSLGLAPKLVHRVLEAVVAVNQVGVTVLLVEQSVEAAVRISSRAYVLHNGRITFEGSRDEVLGERKRFAQRFLWGRQGGRRAEGRSDATG